jgi:hypothetical protein
VTRRLKARARRAGDRVPSRSLPCEAAEGGERSEPGGEVLFVLDKIGYIQYN